MYAQDVVNDGRVKSKEHRHNNTRSKMSPLKVQIILARTPCLCTSACRPIRVLGYCAFDIFERELALELCFERREGSDELRACLFEHCLRGDSAIRLNFEKEIGVKWVRDFVACKEDLGHREHLAVNTYVDRTGIKTEDREVWYVRSEHITQRMVLLDDFERGSVWDFGVFCYFHAGGHYFVENRVAIVTRGTHGFSPSSRTYSSNRFGAFMIGSL